MVEKAVGGKMKQVSSAQVVQNLLLLELGGYKGLCLGKEALDGGSLFSGSWQGRPALNLLVSQSEDTTLELACLKALPPSWILALAEGERVS